MNELLFIVANEVGLRKNTIYLLNDSWDDWFTYSTQYIAYYVDENSTRIRIGCVKIAEKGQTERRALLPSVFSELSENFYSLGTSEDYYLELKDKLKPDIRERVLKALNDIAFNIDIYESVKAYTVTQISLKRDITETMILGQLNRIAHGGSRLTRYSFEYSFPVSYGGEDKSIDFVVILESKPPTNIHAIIGKNGVGKTTLLKNMLSAVYVKDYSEAFGSFDGMHFSNVIFVSYSAFDIPVFETDLPSDRRKIPYAVVGLISQKENGEKYVKDQERLSGDFVDSLYKVSNSYKKKIWNEIIDILSSDMTFAELNIKDWIEADSKILGANNEEDKRNWSNHEVCQADSKILGANNEERKKEFSKKIIEQYKLLSSGHKVILLTLTKLVELVEEKTLVILDEPEEHLHPPLVSAFVRALSKLLIYRNGVGIIATNSPVIVQEIPKKCVWMIRRINAEFVAERPSIQTFGENLGELTEEIFVFEVLNSGFHKMLKEESYKIDDYEEALKEFDNELGKEAQSLLKAYIFERMRSND